MSLGELVLPLRRGLARLRRRARSLALLLGGARLVAFLGVALAGLFAADFLLRLPLSVRAVLLALLVLGVAVVALRHLVRPFLAKLPDEALAERVEAAHPALNDRLRSSLAFVHAADDPENEDSPELMRAVVEETVRDAAALPFARVARAHRPARWAAAAAALTLVLATASAARADLVSIFLRRALLLSDVSWPRRTTLVVEGIDPLTPRRVTLGRETTIRVRAEGAAPDRVRFTFWETEAGPRRADTIDLTPAADDPTLFAFTLKVFSSYRFTVAGGDDDRELVYAIEALTPPAVLSMEMEARYPDYLAMAPATLQGGSQRVPQGTKLRLSVKTNIPLAEASVMLGTDEPKPMDLVAPDVAEVELVADKPVRYSLRLVGRNGEENEPGSDTYLLQVLVDQPPSVRVRTPPVQTERVPSAVVLIAFSAQDDHRVESARLRYRINEELELMVGAGEPGGVAVRALLPPDRPPAELGGLFAIDLSRLRRADSKLVDKGDHITFSLEAVDSGGRVRQTRAASRVDLVGEEELGQLIQGRQQDLRETVRRADGRARDAKEKLDLARDTQGDPEESRRWTTLAQAAQARAVDQLDAVAGRVAGLFNLYVFNRLEDRSAADQALPYFERHLLEPADLGAPPFRGGLYRDLWRAVDEKRIRLGDAQAKLLEMAALADVLATDEGPRAYRALGRMGTAPSTAERDAARADADGAIQTILTGLERLERLMREWENFEGVVRWFRSLKEIEESIVDELNPEKRK
jgi:hypothetical protein